MKKLLYLKMKPILLTLLVQLSALNLWAQNESSGLGLPGDNLNLSAVLDIFQQSKTLEAFEASLNSNENKINNLDLNDDGMVDYIKVLDYKEGRLHSIVLQTDLSANESQDLAVIYVKKKLNGDVDIQIVGDEDLYGQDYVIDVSDQDEEGTPNPGYAGNTNNDNIYYNNGMSFYNWPIITYMYDPFYDPWYSPFRWGYYPSGWFGWRPFFWNDYYFHCYNVYSWYWPHYYYSGRNRFYRQHRNYALDNRKQSRIIAQNRQNGIYEKSYQGNIPVRKPLAGGRVGELPARIIRNETIAQPKQDNLNRNNNQSGTQSERRPAGTISQPIAPRQEYRREEQKQVQPRRESAPRQMETRPSRPVERSPQPTFTPPARQEPQQAPRQSATPSNNGASERRGRR